MTLTREFQSEFSGQVNICGSISLDFNHVLTSNQQLKICKTLRSRTSLRQCKYKQLTVTEKCSLACTCFLGLRYMYYI